MNTLKSPFTRRRACCALLFLAVCSSLALFAAAAAAAPSSSKDLCVGLECDAPASGTYVPEAQDALPAVSGLDELLAQQNSGFYALPALVYRGDVQPRAAVYLAKAGDFTQMPTSVRNLPAVQTLLQARGSEIETITFVVVDHGIRIMAPPEANAAASRSVARHPRARAAVIPGCEDRYFCLWPEVSWIGRNWEISGVLYAGTEWHNFGTNFGSSQVNNRDGDTLLADHSLGEGTRYCAQQQSSDSTFENNPIGNGNASSFALLGRTPDRC